MDEFVIRAAPEVLVAAAEEILGKAQVLESEFAEMQRLMQQTSSFWLGDAANLHRGLFEQQVPQMGAAVEQIRADSDKLKQIAANYASATVFAVDSVEALPSDVIV